MVEWRGGIGKGRGKRGVELAKDEGREGFGLRG